jgi:hypothetical protein
MISNFVENRRSLGKIPAQVFIISNISIIILERFLLKLYKMMTNFKYRKLCENSHLILKIQKYKLVLKTSDKGP